MYGPHPDDRVGRTDAPRRDRVRPLLWVAVWALVWACGDGDGTGPDETGIASVVVSPAVDSLAALGSTTRFTAVARTRTGAAVADPVFTWSTDHPAVASVHDSTGEATALANGTARITATADGVNGSATLHVVQAGVTLVLTTQPAGGPAGEPLPSQPVLEILDANGSVVTRDSSTTVTAVAPEDASVVAGATATATAGVAAFSDLAIGGAAGSYTLRFEADGLPAATSAAFSIDPGPPAELAIAAGDGQTGLAATEIGDSLAVEILDAFGNPAPGVEIAWSAMGEGSLAFAASVSDSTGIARNSYTLGDHAGVDTVLAAIEGLGSPVRFTLTATPNATIAGTIDVSPAAAGSSPGPGTASRSGAGARRPRAASMAPADLVWRNDDASTRGPASTPPSTLDHRPRYTPDELLVVFEPSTVGAPRASAATALSLPAARQVSDRIRTRVALAIDPGLATTTGVSPALGTARVRVADPGRLDETAARLRAAPGVAAVVRNGWRYPDGPTGPALAADPAPPGAAPSAAPAPAPFPSDDPYYAYQAWHYGMIDLPAAWTLTTGARSVIVAVVDDGIRFDHPAVAPNLTGDGYDFTGNELTIETCGGATLGNALDGDGYDPDPTVPAAFRYDPDAGCYQTLTLGGHGLHVAGTVGAVGNDGLGVTGISWNVGIRPVRVLGAAGGSDYDVAQGILYAAGIPADDGAGGTVHAPSRADIINLSFGGSGTSTVERNAVAAASAAGALLVAAAGSTGASDPHYPAALPQTLSVSAVGPDRELASYSNRGPTIDIAAPGGDHDDGGWDHTVWSTMWNFELDGPAYVASDGTSMAAPHVAGVAALLLAHDPSLTATQLRARLLDYAVDLGDPGRDDLYGHGLLNARNSLTRTLAPPTRLFARLYDGSWRVREEVPVDDDGAYAFVELPDGEYYVFAGADRDGDGRIGLPGRRWGAFAEPASPTPVPVDGAGTYGGIDFTIARPREIEPNQDRADASFLPVGGWLRGDLHNRFDTADLFRVRIPTDGQYTFETFPVEGACGFALEEDTFLQLYSPGGTLIAERDDTDLATLDYCSRITTALTAGTYYLQVTGYLGGRYRIQAR